MVPPLVKPDFSEAVKPKPNLPGVYICKIVSSGIKFGKESNLPYVNWKLQTYPENRVVFYSTPLQGKASGMFKHFVHSAGDTKYEEGEYDTGQLVDKLVSMKLAVNEGGYFDVKEVTPLSEEQIKSFGTNPADNDVPW